MYYLLLILDPTTQITLHQNTKQGSQPEDSIRNFQCSSIISNTFQIYQQGMNYIVKKNDQGIESLVFDALTDIPTQSNDNNKNRNNKQTADELTETSQKLAIDSKEKTIEFCKYLYD